jgi:hypothetical protein
MDPRVMLDRLEKLSTAPSASPAVQAPTAPPAAPAQKSWERPAPREREVPPQARESAPIPAAGPSEPQAVLDAWNAFVADVSKAKMSLGSALEDAKISVENNHVVLTFSRAFNQETFQRSTDILKPIMTRHFGGPLTLDSRVDKTPAKPAAAPSAAPVRPAPPAETPETFVEMKAEEMNPDVQRALKHFPGVAKKERR